MLIYISAGRFVQVRQDISLPVGSMTAFNLCLDVFLMRPLKPSDSEQVACGEKDAELLIMLCSFSQTLHTRVFLYLQI